MKWILHHNCNGVGIAVFKTKKEAINHAFKMQFCCWYKIRFSLFRERAGMSVLIKNWKRGATP